MTSIRAKILRAATGKYFSSIDPHTADVSRMRRRLDSWAGGLAIARGVAVEQDELHGMRAEWLRPGPGADGRLILYLHGGGYVMGSCATHRQLVSYLVKAAGVSALLPEYRLAPEHPFPAAVEDAVQLYQALLGAGRSPDDIVVAGDSAGGGLAMSMLLALRDAGEPLPAAACLLSPWLDLTGSGESMVSNSSSDPWFEPEHLPVLADMYCRVDERRDPLVSPVFADLAGLPPLYIQVCADEILLSDSTRIADNAHRAGVTVDVEVYAGLWHVFQAFARYVPESRKAVRRIGEYIRNAVGPAVGSES